MSQRIILASGSQIRQKLLENAGVPHEVIRPLVDEDMLKASLVADDLSPRDVADALSEFKAMKVSQKHTEALVIGCDQVLDASGTIISKPTSLEELKTQIRELSGRPHKLHSALTVCEAGKPIWRHVGTVTLTMRKLSDTFIETYAERNWPGLSTSVGGYKLEEEGARLFVAIKGDYFDVLGLPLLPLLNWLTLRGELDS
ncbi:Maf family protein [Primorskyibacter sp. S187A]|uniref:Maf family protein n=1 Tax=Primorskyibacter sp. S187A TaxID=3415130 RepID=UPI003C7D3CA7